MHSSPGKLLATYTAGPASGSSKLLQASLQVRNGLFKLCHALGNVSNARAHFAYLLRRRAFGKLRIRKLRLELRGLRGKFLFLLEEPLPLLREIYQTR